LKLGVKAESGVNHKYNGGMSTIAAFALGYLAKVIASAVLGKFVNYALDEVENWPTVMHYLNNHAPKRSVGCQDCLYPIKVDTINQN